MGQRDYRGIFELYRQDKLSADKRIWGRETDPVTRRGFLRGSGLAAMSTALGMGIPYARFMPAGLLPAAFASDSAPFEIPGKDGLIVLNDRPINAETPAHLLDDSVTPVSRLFVRNNGIPPPKASIDPSSWTLNIDGESCGNPTKFSLDDLFKKFDHYTYQLQLECGGNGRSEFNPPAPGNQWSTGAIGCPMWTGVRLRDVLSACDVKEDAVYVAYYGADTHATGSDKVPISRGVPISKAMEDETLIAWAVNDQDLPLLHGYPLRLVCGGWPASTSGKWLTKLAIRNRVHDGAKMGGQSYRVPCEPVAPGTQVSDERMCIIESMPVKSLVSYPKSGIYHPTSKPLTVRGHAWAGDATVEMVHVSIDFGATWLKAKLEVPVNRLAWQQWSTELRFPQDGYYEIWARATDDQGRSQPMVLPAWNPKGYLNNACHRVAVQVQSA